MAISGFYVGLYGVFKILSAAFSSPKKAEIGESVTTAVAASYELKMWCCFFSTVCVFLFIGSGTVRRSGFMKNCVERYNRLIPVANGMVKIRPFSRGSY